jgi:hypothetical protein
MKNYKKNSRNPFDSFFFLKISLRVIYYSAAEAGVEAASKILPDPEKKNRVGRCWN